MSAIGPKRTSPLALHMSAFGGKADIAFCGANVCFDPKRTKLQTTIAYPYPHICYALNQIMVWRRLKPW